MRHTSIKNVVYRKVRFDQDSFDFFIEKSPNYERKSRAGDEVFFQSVKHPSFIFIWRVDIMDLRGTWISKEDGSNRPVL